MLEDWLGQVFSYPGGDGLLIIAGKTAVIYLFLVAGLRLFGKRELGQMNIYDLVLIIVLANSVQNAMVGNDTTLAGGIVAAFTLLLLNRITTLAMARWSSMERYLVGQATLLSSEGKLLPENLKREGITPEQVMAALREHGLERLDQVRIAVLEVDGTISVVPYEATIHRSRRHYRALRLP